MGAVLPPTGSEKVAFSRTSPRAPRLKSPRSPPAEAVGPPESVRAMAAKLPPARSLPAMPSALAWAASSCAWVAFSGVGMRISLRCTCSGSSEVLLVGVVVGELIGVGHVEMAADLVAHHLLADDLIADVLLEVFEGDALLGGGLLEGLHVGQVVLLADVVELADGLGVAGDAELLALGEQELLIDEVAEQVMDAVVEVGLGEILLASFLQELVFGGLVLGAGDDLVVDAGDGIFDDGAVGRDGGGGGQGRNGERGGRLEVGAGRLVAGLLRERSGAGQAGAGQGSGEDEGGDEAGLGGEAATVVNRFWSPPWRLMRVSFSVIRSLCRYTRAGGASPAAQ